MKNNNSQIQSAIDVDFNSALSIYGFAANKNAVAGIIEFFNKREKIFF